ncbi:uncharacterized protein LOC108319357 [Vigna angularis]|uniref:uncharacterized protein LOC108319357 n=1 Tax=Phaseolus angularis TaxID=3914 RepID=UPI0022B44A5C|nr:uncharacterized protein LOC108319357 [Vigna angularis]
MVNNALHRHHEQEANGSHDEESPNEATQRFYKLLTEANLPVFEGSSESKLSVSIRLLAAMTGQGSDKPDKGKGVARPKKRQRKAPKYVLRVPSTLPTPTVQPPSTPAVHPPSPTPAVHPPPPTPVVHPPAPTHAEEPLPPPVIIIPTPPPVIITPTPPPEVITPTPPPDPTSIASSSSTPPSAADAEDVDPPFHDRPWIEPYGKGFIPSRVASQAITRSIKQQYLTPWPTWGAIPIDDRKPFWERFKKKVQWKAEHESQIHRNFHMKASHRLSEMFRDARIAGERPDWMGEIIWNSLLAHWNTVEFRKKSATAQKNRSSERGGALHTGGSITIHEHAIRMVISSSCFCPDFLVS